MIDALISPDTQETSASMWMSHLPEIDRAVATDAIARGKMWEKEQTVRINED